MSFYKTFYLLSDPFNEEPKIVGSSEENIHVVLQGYAARALNNKDKTDIDEWVLELMDKNRSPLIKNLGQFKFISDFAANEKLKSLEDVYFPKDEISETLEEIMDAIPQNTEPETEQVIEPEPVKEIPISKSAPKKKTKKRKTPVKKRKSKPKK